MESIKQINAGCIQNLDAHKPLDKLFKLSLADIWNEEGVGKCAAVLCFQKAEVENLGKNWKIAIAVILLPANSSTHSLSKGTIYFQNVWSVKQQNEMPYTSCL